MGRRVWGVGCMCSAPDAHRVEVGGAECLLDDCPVWPRPGVDPHRGEDGSGVGGRGLVQEGERRRAERIRLRLL